MKRLFAVLVLAGALLVMMVPQPGSATVHEIVSQWCSGHDPLEPFGISRDGSMNFAQPLRAGGVVQLTPFMGGLLIDFNFDAPQIKIVPTGNIITIIPGVLWMEEFTLDPDHPAFGNCPKLNS
jgi:hypothetical protein